MDNLSVVPDLETRPDPKNYNLFPDPVADDVYTPEYAKDKADKLAVTLGDANPGTDILQSDVTSGAQRQWLEVLKNQDDNAIMMQRNAILTNILSSRDPEKPVTQDDIRIVQNLSNDELYSTDVNTILEKKYADLFTNKLASHDEAAVAQEALAENEDSALEAMDRMQAPLQRAQIVQDVLESTKAKYESESTFDYLLDAAKSMVPLYDTLKGRERIETPTGSLLLGNNREEQISQLYAMPPAKFKETLKDIVDELAKDNVPAAMSFIQAVSSMSQNDKGFGNLGTVADAASLIPAGAAGRLAKGLSNMKKAVIMAPSRIPVIAAEAGFNKTAAIGTISKDILAGDLSGATTVRRLEEIGDQLPSLMNPTKMLDGSTRMDAEATARLRQAVSENADKVLGVLKTGSLVDRLEPQQVIASVSEMQSKIKDMFPSNVQNIIDSQVIPASEDLVTNTPVLAVRFGQRDGTMFKSEAQAKNYARRYIGIKTNDFSVNQNNLGGYYIEVRKPIADVGDFRKAVIDTDLQSPDTLNGVFARSLRSPDFLLPKQNVAARGRVVHTSEFLSQVLRDVTRPFNGKSSQWYDEMDSMFRLSRVNQKYFADLGEFESAFYKKFQKVPEESQAEAYFLYRQINDLDYMIRDADKVKKYTAKGFSNFSMNVVDGEGAVNTEAFIGRVVDQLPPTDRPYKIRIVEKGKKPQNLNSFSKNWEQNKKAIDGLLKNGYKIIEHGDEPLYTISKDFKNDSIKMKTLSYKEGGHFEPKYDFYISQGDFDSIGDAKIFKGDKNLATAVTQDQANEIARIFDQARVLYKNKDPMAPKFIEENLPISYAEFTKKVKVGDIDLDAPVLARRSGMSTTDTFKYESIYPTFQDYKHSEYNPLADTTVKYGTERADELLDVWAAEYGKFVYKTNYEPLLSPMDALSSATKNMVNVRVLEDYAMKSANDWVQEFGHMLNVPTETLKSNPRYYLQNPIYSTSVGTDKAEAARLSILSLFNTLDTADVTRLAYRDKMLSKAYNLGGERLRAFANDKMYTAKDAQSLIRSAAFNLKLGFWNPKQYFLQASTVATAVAASPRAGIRAMQALTMTRLALINGDEAVVNGLYKKFGKLSGWEKDDWIAMVRSFRQSGLAEVGGDLSYLDRLQAPSLGGQFKQGWKNSKIVKSSTAPFEEGERIARIMGYATAWSEFRTANPQKAIDRFAETRILQRAKDLTSNMTRDSSARWQKGWAGIATQFWGYQSRVAEAMWDGGLFQDGRKFTRGEKLRMMGMMSSLYGAGTSAAMVTMIPTTQVMRQWIADQGVDPDAVPGLEVFLDGAPATLVKGVLGADVDFSSFGPTGLTSITDLFNEDKSWADTMMGAGPGVLSDLYDSGTDLARLAALKIRFGYTEGALTTDEVVSVFRNISTVDNAYKAYLAMNTGRWITRKGGYIADVTGTEALMGAILGTQPMAVTDAFVQNQSNKNFKKGRDEGLRQYRDLNVKSNRAYDAGDPDAALIYRRQRDAIGIIYGLTLGERASVASSTMFEESLSQKTADQALENERRYNQYVDKKRN